MKKLIALVICAVMILSMIPAVTLTASAAVEGDWYTRRSPASDDPEDYTPAAGYHYTSEGFQTISADFTNCTPYYTVETKEAWNLQDGIHMEVRVDQFSYRGITGQCDEWITLSLWDAPTVNPGNLNYGSGWLCLIRGTGEGAPSVVESYWTTANNEEGVGGSFAPNGNTSITPEVDENGCEHYTLDVEWNGSEYDIKVCGVTVGGMSNISDKMKDLVASGDFYVGITFHSTEAGGTADLTILNFNGKTPVGDDSAEPQENVKVVAPLADPSTIPENQPCLLWDATKSSFKKDPESAQYEITPQGDNSYHFKAIEANGMVTWGIKNSLSYSADDFPVVAFLLRNYYGNGGIIYYGAGEILSAGNDVVANWSPYDDDCEVYGEDDEYQLIVIDLSYRWFDRINFLRVDFHGADTTGDESEWDVMWMGMFRSADEAKAYTQGFLGMNNEEETKVEGGEETTVKEDTVTEAPTQPETEKDTEPKQTEAVETKGETVADTTAEAETGDTKGGCSSVIGGAVAVLMTAMTAGVALKKRR